jgi:hypothetical protein
MTGWYAGVEVQNFGGSNVCGIKKAFVIKRRLDSINMAATYSPGWNTSTIGHKGLNFSVRYGKR